MQKLSDEQKKTLFAWTIIAIIIFLIIALIASKKISKKVEEEKVLVAAGTKEIINKSRYYTIKGALEKYYSFISMNNKDAVYKILSDKYKKDNNITKSSIDSYIDFDTEARTIKTGIICYEKSKKGVYTFAVEGNEITSNTGKVKDEVFYRVVLDGNTQLFSVEPIEEKDYEDVCNG